MGKGTSFDPDVLEDAYNDLQKINTIIDNSSSLADIGEASSIENDIGGLDDDNGGWGYVGKQVSTTGGAVKNHVDNLKQITSQVAGAMRSSIDTLKGADTDSKTAVNQSGSDLPANPQGRG